MLLPRVVVVDSIAALARNETERHVADQQQLLGDIWPVPQLAVPLLLPTVCCWASVLLCMLAHVANVQCTTRTAPFHRC